MEYDLEQLMHHAIDMHCHVQFDTSDDSLQTQTTESLIETCHEDGMKGIVLKTHGWPAVRLAKKLNSVYRDFHVYPSVTLNVTAGGPYPWVVEMAYQLGAKFIWLPTWSSLNDRKSKVSFTQIMIDKNYNRFFKDIPEECFYAEINGEGNLKQNIKDIVNLCKEHNLVLGTGHGSTEEALAVAKYAQEVGFSKLVFTHPNVGVSDVTDVQIKEFTECGGYIELCMLETEPFADCMTPDHWLRICRNVGFDHCFLSSDHFWDWPMSIPAQFRHFLTNMHNVGASMDELMQMMNVPEKLMAE